MERSGPRQWARLRLLHACERLDIPGKLWPKFQLQLPRTNIVVLHIQPDFESPPFLPLQETLAEWKIRCQEAFNEFLEAEANPIGAEFQERVKSGMYTKITPSRSTTPLDLRYEWAAKRICYRTPFPELAEEEAAKGYTEARIKKAVQTIIKEIGWRQGK